MLKFILVFTLLILFNSFTFAQCAEGSTISKNRKCTILSYSVLPTTVDSQIWVDEGGNGGAILYSYISNYVQSGTYYYVYSKNGSTNGCNKFDTFTGTIEINGVVCTYNSGTLPVIYRDVEIFFENGALIKWSTESESNNDIFVIERSKNGIHFETIGEVKGSGYSNGEKSYQYNDKKPFSGTSFYRIVQIDYDGKATIGKILKFYNTDRNHKVYFQKSLLTICMENVKNSRFQVFNSSGIKVHSGIIEADTKSINVSSWLPGLYIIRLNDYDMINYKVMVY